MVLSAGVRDVPLDEPGREFAEGWGRLWACCEEKSRKLVLPPGEGMTLLWVDDASLEKHPLCSSQPRPDGVGRCGYLRGSRVMQRECTRCHRPFARQDFVKHESKGLESDRKAAG